MKCTISKRLYMLTTVLIKKIAASGNNSATGHLFSRPVPFASPPGNENLVCISIALNNPLPRLYSLNYGRYWSAVVSFVTKSKTKAWRNRGGGTKIDLAPPFLRPVIGRASSSWNGLAFEFFRFQKDAKTQSIAAMAVLDARLTSISIFAWSHVFPCQTKQNQCQSMTSLEILSLPWILNTVCWRTKQDQEILIQLSGSRG